MTDKNLYKAMQDAIRSAEPPGVLVFSPCEPPKDAAVLVRVTTPEGVECVRSVIRDMKIQSWEGSRAEDDLTFYILSSREDRAEAARRVRAKLSERAS